MRVRVVKESAVSGGSLCSRLLLDYCQRTAWLLPEHTLFTSRGRIRHKTCTSRTVLAVQDRFAVLRIFSLLGWDSLRRIITPHNDAQMSECVRI